MKHIFVGLGRMGVAQARIARYFGDEIVMGIDADAGACAFFAEEFGAHAFSSVRDVPKESDWESADIVWITVTDRALASCAAEVAPHVLHSAVIHTSGATPYTVLGQCGARRGSMHPLMSCPPKDACDSACVATYRNVIHATDGDDAALETISRLVSRLGGKQVRIDAEKKGMYHAAAVFASNYPVVLAETAENLLKSCGFDEASAREACAALLSQAARSIAGATPREALTGPAKRNDLPTIERHRTALKMYHDGEYSELYEALLRAARAMC